MTREEAIEYNKNLREYMMITDKVSECKFLKENYEALEMAIESLEHQPCEDAISRHAVIELVKNSYYDLCSSMEDTWAMVEDVERLPSVNPQEPILDKIRERVELEKLGYPPSAGYYIAIMKVLQIIDKYKESEE